MTANEMVSELQALVQEGEIPIEDVPEKTTVANWIKRYAAGLKQLAARKVEESNATKEVDPQGMTGSSNEVIDVREKGKKMIFDDPNNSINNIIEHLTKRQKKINNIIFHIFC